MMNQLIKSAAAIVICFFALSVSSVCYGQDRDITEGSSTGSIRTDVSQRPTGPRRRMLTTQSRAGLVNEFEMFRGAETLLNATSFESLKDAYSRALEKVAAEKPIATDLTPLKYLVFELMARNMSQQKPSINADQLAEAMISTYVKTGDFMPPLLSAGFSREEAKRAESDAVAALMQIPRRGGRLAARAAATSAGAPSLWALGITYGVRLEDRPRDAGAGAAKRKGTLGLTLRVAPGIVVGVTNDTFSSKRRADGTYITGIGNTTPSLKYEALDENKSRPALSFTYSITLPTASVAKTLGTGRVDHKIVGDISKTVGDTKLGLSLGGLFAGRKGAPGHSKTGLAVLSLAHPLSKRVASNNELDLATRADKTPSEIFAINQISYRINDTFSLRAGVRTGLTVNSPRVGFTGGLAVNTNLKKIFK